LTGCAAFTLTCCLHFRCTGEVIKLLHHTLTSHISPRQSHQQDSSKAHLMRQQHGLTLWHMQVGHLQGV